MPYVNVWRVVTDGNSLQVYLNDSVGQKITALDFDLETGAVSNQRTLVDFHGTTSEPDGMVIE